MPINIGSNIASLRAQRQLTLSSKELATTSERLSSGMRINKSSDDAAGLAIASQLNSSKRVFNQGIRNFNDGLSLLSIADSALEQLSGIVTRIQELATQSANGIFGHEQREALDNEAQALSKEYLRIIQTTKFSGRSVLTSDMGTLRLQGGFGLDGSIASNLGGKVGDGLYLQASRYQSNNTTTGDVVLGDINGDGILDMISGTRFEVSPGVYQEGVSMFFGKGDGTFGEALSIIGIAPNGMQNLSLADMNNDGILDIVANDSDNVSVLLGKGSGSFNPAMTYRIGLGSVNGATLADMDNDGNLDLVSSVNNGTGLDFSVSYGNGSGGFSRTVSTAAESYGQEIRVADVNNDGIMDVITGGQNLAGNNNLFGVHLGNGNGTFQAAHTIQAHDSIIFDFQLGDFNGDGNIDLASVGTDSGGNALRINLGNGDGTFGSTQSYEMSYLTASLEVGDLNGDGFSDIIASGINSSYENEITVRMGQGDGTFGSLSMQSSGSSLGANTALGDINGDGVLDLVMAGSSDLNFTDLVVASFLGQTTTGTSPLLEFSLATQADSLHAIPALQRKLSQLAEQRGTIGAFQARLSVGVNSLTTTAENYAAAASRITDVDVAAESANLVRLQILQNAASSILAQANQQPALAVRLLNAN